jgi:hypothetical protein
VTALPDPEAFTRNSMSSFDRALTHEAQEWLDRVLDLRDQAKAERRAAPSFYKIADQLSDHLAVKVTRHDVEGYRARRIERATES